MHIPFVSINLAALQQFNEQLKSVHFVHRHLSFLKQNHPYGTKTNGTFHKKPIIFKYFSDKVGHISIIPSIAQTTAHTATTIKLV